MSSEEIKFIRRAKQTPRWAWVFYVIIALLLIIFVFYYLFSIFQDEMEKGRAHSGYFKSLKCTSLCPTESVYNENGQLVKLFDASCKRVCEITYIDALSEREISFLPIKNPIYSDLINYNRRYSFCKNQMEFNSSFIYHYCFQELFWNVSKNFDLSETRAPIYTPYFFRILDSDCGSNPSIKIEHMRGSANNLSLTFSVEDIMGKTREISNSVISSVGSSQTYPLSVRGIDALFRIGVFVKDVRDNRSVINPLWKICTK